MHNALQESERAEFAVHPAGCQSPIAFSAEETDRPGMRLDNTLRVELGAWYHAHRRQLPWREEPSPYRVWVSEIMLQQTQVATVIPYFDRFLHRFPSVEALASAEESDVLAVWSGLGYYRRARLLHRGARMVMETLKGRIPHTAEALKALPGIGPYTAGAIASIAFGEAVPLVDGNVNRVLSRLTADPTPIDTAAGQHAMWDLATRLLDREDPSAHNQAMMELGALVCTPKNPTCGRCPWTAHCRAYATGQVQAYPQKRGRVKVKRLSGVCGIARRPDGALLLARRPADALLGGTWEFPAGEVAPTQTSPCALVTSWRERLGLSPQVTKMRGQIQHVFTHRRLTLEVFDVTVGDHSLPLSFYTDARWVKPENWGELPISRLTEKVYALTEGPDE